MIQDDWDWPLATFQSLSHLLSSILLTLRLVGELRVQEAQRTKVFLFGDFA